MIELSDDLSYPGDQEEAERGSSHALAKIYGQAVNGLSATTITIEAQCQDGVRYTLVGLPDTAVKESRERVEAALLESGIAWKRRRYIINMSPADIRKEGAAYDLPLAVVLAGLMCPLDLSPLERVVVMGELSLDGQIQPIHGILPMAINAVREGFRAIIVPRANAREAAVVDGLTVYAADTLTQVLAFVSGTGTLEVVTDHTTESDFVTSIDSMLDFADVKGQEEVRRAMEVAAAGNHNILMVGAPGSGKSMMAKRLPAILPPLTKEEAIETTMIHSVAGVLPPDSGLMTQRPFRSPHHTTSGVALVGGGTYPKPGEISLAHNGVLFLDELPEFSRHVLEVLRQPLEDRIVTVSRARGTITFPASFMLVASMNPCPCGNYNNPAKDCTCLPGQISAYLGRLSGPLLDRIDIQVEIVPVPFEALSSREPGESSAVIRERVLRARAIQSARYRDIPGIYTNAQMTPALMKEYIHIDSAGRELLRRAMDHYGLSARAYDRILKVSRTIADLEGSPEVLTHHIGEAVNYRKLDRSSWGEVKS